jgi:hypothetical protein
VLDGPNELLVRVDCGGYKLDRQGGAPAASLGCPFPRPSCGGRSG